MGRTLLLMGERWCFEGGRAMKLYCLDRYIVCRASQVFGSMFAVDTEATSGTAESAKP
jgi:hypothetical protein